MDFRGKIKTNEELAGVLTKFKQDGKKIVHCHGVFDLLHRGHIHQFEQARELGDVLVVSLTADRYVAKGPGRPIFNQKVRAEMIASLELVDFVTIVDAPNAVEVIRLFRPDAYVKGASVMNNNKDFSGGLESKTVESIGGKMHFTAEMPIHATSLINTYVDPFPEEVLNFLNDLKKKYSVDRVLDAISGLNGLKVLVIGEAIVDQYDYIDLMDSSPKGGVIAGKHINTEYHAGGSLACANHIANFCSDVTLVSNLGTVNSYESTIRNLLTPNINARFLMRNDIRTIVKRREVERAYFKKHSETYILDDKVLSKDEESELIGLIGDLSRYDLVFVTDYGHGFITKNIIKYLTGSPAFLAVNTQANSANKGFHVITKYPRADYPCIDHYEARLATRNKEKSFEFISEVLKRYLNASYISITLGNLGSMIRGNNEFYITPIFSKKIVDTVGAGDAYFSLTAPCIKMGLPLDMVGFIGNTAGALATTYIGNKAFIDKKMLYNFIGSLLA